MTILSIARRIAHSTRPSSTPRLLAAALHTDAHHSPLKETMEAWDAIRRLTTSPTHQEGLRLLIELKQASYITQEQKIIFRSWAEHHQALLLVEPILANKPSAPLPTGEPGNATAVSTSPSTEHAR